MTWISVLKSLPPRNQFVVCVSCLGEVFPAVFVEQRDDSFPAFRQFSPDGKSMLTFLVTHWTTFPEPSGPLKAQGLISSTAIQSLIHSS